MLTHERAPVKSLHEIAAHWTLDDLLDANLALDAWDDAQRRATDAADRDAKRSAAAATESNAGRRRRR